MKLTTAQIKQLPKPVQDKVMALRKQYRTRHTAFEQKSPGETIYLEEGARYTFFNQRLEAMQANMVSSDTIGAANTGVNYAVGQRIPMPAGAWVVEFELFLGKPFVNVHHFGTFQLEA